MNEAFQKLKELGVGEFAHVDGSLIDHLQGTRKLLKEWSASKILQDAGLYHAAYGTASYTESFTSLQKRDEISNIIGTGIGVRVKFILLQVGKKEGRWIDDIKFYSDSNKSFDPFMFF